jgi:hypothetical protein
MFRGGMGDTGRLDRQRISISLHSLSSSLLLELCS